MLIDNITLRIKNKIFFKLISQGFIFAFLLYLISSTQDSIDNLKAKIIKTTELVLESEERLLTLNKEEEKIHEILDEFNNLKNQEIMNLDSCFNKIDYETKIRKIESDLKIKNKSNIYASSNSFAAKHQPKKSITLKTTSVKIDFHIDEFDNAINFAKKAYEALPEHNFFKSFEITKQSTITPSIASLINTDNSFIINANLNFEVRELDINE